MRSAGDSWLESCKTNRDTNSQIKLRQLWTGPADTVFAVSCHIHLLSEAKEKEVRKLWSALSVRREKSKGDPLLGL